MLLGESVDPADSAFVRQLQGTTDTLNTLIGKNYVPSYPVYVLSVLQALDSATPIDITASTHGYFYELFIRTTLARGRNRKDFDVVASYLAFVSYRMEKRGIKIIGSDELRAVHDAYEERYDIRRPFAAMLRQLVDQGIFTGVNDGFRFKYSYLYNYFVASYMRDHMAEPDVREMLGDISRAVHTERNANILLFLAHLSRDPIIIGELLSASRDLYAGYPPAELKEDIQFLAELWPGLPEVVYDENDPKVSRGAMLAEMDRNSVPDTGLDEAIVDEEQSDVDESTDGRREDSGRGVRELRARWPGLHWGRWEGGGRSSVAARAPMAVCGDCDARDGERIHSRDLSRTRVARVCGDLRLCGG